jgi:hypothetical protein
MEADVGVHICLHLRYMRYKYKNFLGMFLSIHISRLKIHSNVVDLGNNKR